jgi:hypothetical protein
LNSPTTMTRDPPERLRGKMLCSELADSMAGTTRTRKPRVQGWAHMEWH